MINKHTWLKEPLDSIALGCFSGVQTNGSFNLLELAVAEEHKTNKTSRRVSNTVMASCTEYVQMIQEGTFIQPVIGQTGQASVGPI